jgi:hypothetical protein
VTAPKVELTPAQQDSLAKRMLMGVSWEEWHKPLNPDEVRDVRARREPGLAPNARAARLPGEPVYAPLMSGGYAVGYTGISIPLGPSREKERKQAASIDSEYQARLARLQERVKQQRAIARTDSTLRDSLRRLARRP